MAGMSSDHFSPWSERQGEKGFAWAFLGAALATTSIPFGVVNAPGQRYHPAIVAQAIATLAQMFPGRFWGGAGLRREKSIERANNRSSVAPCKEVRYERLVECVDVIRRLLSGEEVSHEGRVHVNRAGLWTLPETIPYLLGPAVTQDRCPACRMGGRTGHRQPVQRRRCNRSLTRTAKRAGVGLPGCRSTSAGRPATTKPSPSHMTSGAATSSAPPPACWDVEVRVETFYVISEDVSPDQVKKSVQHLR